MNEEMKELFADLHIVVEGNPVKLNVIGIMNIGGDEVIVISDVPALNIGPNEYDIFHLDKDGDTVGIASIENEGLHQTLCNIWEERVWEENNG